MERACAPCTAPCAAVRVGIKAHTAGCRGCSGQAQSMMAGRGGTCSHPGSMELRAACGLLWGGDEGHRPRCRPTRLRPPLPAHLLPHVHYCLYRHPSAGLWSVSFWTTTNRTSCRRTRSHCTATTSSNLTGPSRQSVGATGWCGGRAITRWRWGAHAVFGGGGAAGAGGRGFWREGTRRPAGGDNGRMGSWGAGTVPVCMLAPVDSRRRGRGRERLDDAVPAVAGTIAGVCKGQRMDWHHLRLTLTPLEEKEVGATRRTHRGRAKGVTSHAYVCRSSHTMSATCSIPRLSQLTHSERE